MQIFKKGDSLIAKICDVDRKKAHFFYALDNDHQKFQFLETYPYTNDNSHKVFEFSESTPPSFEIPKKRRKRIII